MLSDNECKEILKKYGTEYTNEEAEAIIQLVREFVQLDIRRIRNEEK